MNNGWIGVDLDGTLAHYDHWRGPGHIGEPVPLMVERVKLWLSAGKDVRIFTARVSRMAGIEGSESRAAILDWCDKHLGRQLEITAEKDLCMIELWDDRCVQVIKNTGQAILIDETSFIL